MARPRVNINPVCGQRLKKILSDTGTTHDSLANKINISRQSISSMIHGKASITDSVAHSIIEIFPQYRIQWLLGYDDYENETILALNDMKDFQYLLGLFSAMVKMSGISIEFIPPFAIRSDPNDKRPANTYEIGHNGKKAIISMEEFNSIACNVQKYATFLLDEHIKENSSTT